MDRKPIFTMRNPVFAAAVILAVVNCLLIFVDPIAKVDADSLPAPRGWAYWAVQDFKERDVRPQVVILGSSNMMQPVWFQEAQHRQENVEIIADHRSTYLQSVIEKRLPSARANCFNFALPGAMMSDMAMVVRTMFTDERKPDVAVIGLGVRDLMDNTFHCPAGTKHYQYLTRFEADRLPADLTMPNWWYRPRYWVQDTIYFKKRSKDLQIVVTAFGHKLLDPVLKLLPASPLDQTSEEDRRLVIFQEELSRGIWVARPNSPYHYIDSAFDCQRRLKKSYDEMFDNQKQWLEICLSDLRKKQVEPVLVNMPLSPAVKAIVRPAIYERHVNTLSEMSKKYGCPYVDMNAGETFVAEDFSDWAHMDASGGQKLLDGIGKTVAASRAAARLEAPRSELAAKNHGSL